MAESNSQPTRCPCGFFGSAQTLGLCSKCYREREQSRDHHQVMTSTDSLIRATPNSNIISLSSSPSLPSSTTPPPFFYPSSPLDSYYANHHNNASENKPPPTTSFSPTTSTSLQPTSSNPASSKPTSPKPLFTNNTFSKKLSSSTTQPLVDTQTTTTTTLTSGTSCTTQHDTSAADTPPTNQQAMTQQATPKKMSPPDSDKPPGKFPSPSLHTHSSPDKPPNPPSPPSLTNNSNQNVDTPMHDVTTYKTTPSSVPSLKSDESGVCTVTKEQGMVRVASDSFVSRSLKRKLNDDTTTNNSSDDFSSSSSSSSLSEMGQQKNKKRCYECKCKLDLALQAIGRCKCNYIFCPLHRLPEQHNCTFNHKEVSREEARSKMVVFKKHVGTALKRLDSDS